MAYHKKVCLLDVERAKGKAVSVTNHNALTNYSGVAVMLRMVFTWALVTAEIWSSPNGNTSLEVINIAGWSERTFKSCSWQCYTGISRILTRTQAGRSGVRIPAGEKNFSYPEPSTLNPVSTQPHVQWVSEAYSTGVQWPVREANPHYFTGWYKVNFVPWQAMKAQRGSTRVALLFLKPRR